MDPSQLHILTETGIICGSQTMLKLESRYNKLKVGQHTYQLVLHHENLYQISKFPTIYRNNHTVI